MARIDFKADAKSDTGGKKFEPCPRGVYTLEVTAVSNGEKTQGGNNPGTPMTKIECEVAEGPYLGSKVWLTVTWLPAGKKGHGMAVHFLHAVGMEYDGEFSFEESDFEKRQFRALLGIESYEKVKDGQTYQNEKNVVETIYTDSHPEPKEIPPQREKKPLVKQLQSAREKLKARQDAKNPPGIEEALPF